MDPNDPTFYQTRSVLGVPVRALQYYKIAQARIIANIRRQFQLGQEQALRASVGELVDLKERTEIESNLQASVAQLVDLNGEVQKEQLREQLRGDPAESREEIIDYYLRTIRQYYYADNPMQALEERLRWISYFSSRSEHQAEVLTLQQIAGMDRLQARPEPDLPPREPEQKRMKSDE